MSPLAEKSMNSRIGYLRFSIIRVGIFGVSDRTLSGLFGRFLV
jgi:hypothetical protein